MVAFLLYDHLELELEEPEKFVCPSPMSAYDRFPGPVDSCFCLSVESRGACPAV